MMDNMCIIDNCHWDYQQLLCYKKAVVIYDLTFYFCSRFLDPRDRTYDQMIQAARSGKQNISEGYTDAETSYEMALKLYNVARGSHKELLEDYRDYLRTRGFSEWAVDSNENMTMRRIGIEHTDSQYFIEIASSRSDSVIANMAIVLLHQQDRLLRNFIQSEVQRFSREGGFRERLSTIRKSYRR